MMCHRGSLADGATQNFAWFLSIALRHFRCSPGPLGAVTIVHRVLQNRARA